MEQQISIRERLRRLPTKQLWGGSEDLWCYRKAAAVLASFEYESLLPYGPVKSDSNSKEELLGDCDLSYEDGDNRVWSLRTPIRREALRRLLAENSVQGAIEANPERRRTIKQLVLEHWLGVRTASPQVGSYAEGASLQQVLIAELEVLNWLDDLPGLNAELPSIALIKIRLAREQLLQPFRELVGAYFAGRREELSRLEDYVGVYDSAHFSESARRTVEYIFSIRERPPLFVHGPGGCGKSTLIAKFVLRHAEIEEKSHFPFAYLDFDRPALLAEEPVTLLNEIMRQLAIQFPSCKEEYQRLSAIWTAMVSESEIKSEAPPVLKELPEMVTKGKFRLEDRSRFMGEFALFVNNMKSSDQPFLLVLDTFEEVQFRSAAYADEVLDFLDALQSRVPKLRTVLCGRAEIRSKEFSVRPLEIGNFDEEAAVSFLGGMGISDAAIATAIFEQVGGSPLVLRLAADVAKLESVDTNGIADLNSGWLSIFRERSIEVVLYKRILSHIRDKRIEQIAYPGLILRAINGEILLRVLAPSCGVSIHSPSDAEEMISTMRAQLSTILIPGGNVEPVTLVHRPDMRSILLSDVAEKARKDKAVARKLQDIHVAAVEFYSQSDEAAHRAEEIYHRLALGVDRQVLASRWIDGLTPYLGSSIRELPEKSQIYLASRLGLELPDDLWSQAEDEDWVFYACRMATQNLELGKPFECLKFLSARQQLWNDPLLQPVVRRMIDAIFVSYADRYEIIRKNQKSGAERTRAMNALVREAINMANSLPLDRSYAQELFSKRSPGCRVIALGVAAALPYPEHMDLAIDAIQNSLSPFEQFHALRLARGTFDRATDAQRDALREALLEQRGIPIHESDPSRLDIKNELLDKLATRKKASRKKK